MFARAAAYGPALQHRYDEKRISVVGPSSQAERSKAGAQRSVNWFPVKPERDGDEWFLRGRPGLLELCELARTPIRGLHVHEYSLFSVAGGRIYSVTVDGTIFDWSALVPGATLPTTTGRVVMASLGTVLIIGDGTGFYALDTGLQTFSLIAGAPRGTFCLTFNLRVLYQEFNTGKVWYSELNDPTNIEGLNFFTAESLPDAIVAMTATEDQVWLHGENGTEVWFDSGDADNPFQRISGGVMYSGCAHPHTALRLDNSIWWVETDKDGAHIVRRSNGFTPQRVSTSAVERFIAQAAPGGLSAYSYQEDGHIFYCLNAMSLNTGGTGVQSTWCFDLQTQEWHERAWLNRSTGDQQRHRVEFHAFVYGRHVVGDYENGKLYFQSLDYHSDDGQEIRRSRIMKRFNDGGRNLIVDELWLDFATGVGLDGAGQGTDPLVMLRCAPEGGGFGSEVTCPLGAIGEYDQQVRFHGLGVGRDWLFEVSVSDPVFTALMGAEVKYRVGRR